jgi:hypothetical protein
MRCVCPHCSEKVAQRLNRTGPNFCPNCCKLFHMPILPPTPHWVFGAMAVMLLNLHVNLGFPGSALAAAGM